MGDRDEALWSIGHSNHGPGQFLELLESHGIRGLADVRRYPGSRRHPWFARSALQEACVDAGLQYAWLGESLGGHREPDEVPDLDPSELAGIQGRGFRAYAAHLRSPAAAAGLEELLRLGRRRPTAMLCAEGDPLRCHRRLIADLLVARGHRVRHALGPGESREHQLPAGARLRGGHLRYPDPSRLPGL